MARVSGKKAIITGGAQGLGEATAWMLAREGAKVTVTDINGDGADAVAAAINAELGDGTAFAWQHDVTDGERWKTVVQDAHDAMGGLNILVNNAGLAGHAIVGDDVIVGGLSGVHQWVRVGRGAIIGAVTMVTNDVIPHGLVQAPRGELDGLNLIGLKRRGVARSDITALRAAFQMLAQGEGTFQDRARRLGEETESDYVRQIVDFVSGATDRSFLTPGSSG